MSNERRKRQDFIGGLIDNDPLAVGGTSFDSAALAAITGGVASTDHLAITLDPDGLYGAPEIAYITALTAGATTGATIARSQEGTTAREHLRDTPWVHGPTVRDYAKTRRVIGDGAGNHSTPGTGTWYDIAAQYSIDMAAYEGDLLLLSLDVTWDISVSNNHARFNFSLDGTDLSWAVTHGNTDTGSRHAHVQYPHRVTSAEAALSPITVKPRFYTSGGVLSVNNEAAGVLRKPVFMVTNLGPEAA